MQQQRGSAMWRWIIRIYVSSVLFLFLLFCSGVLLIRVAHLLMKAGSPFLLQSIHAHVLLTMFLLGMAAGLTFLGSRFTGRGWFRSKDGQTYEGFRLEELKPWTWLFGSLIFLLGVVLWCLEQGEKGVLSNLTPANFYHDFVIPDCSSAWVIGYKSEIAVACTMQLLFGGIWLASIGYSLAPMARRRSMSLLHSFRAEPEAGISTEESQASTIDRKSEL